MKDGDLVIDIGAHTGDTTIPMAIASGKNGCTVALEPNHFVYKILKRNSELNKEKTNIVPLNFAATKTDGPYVFHYSDASYCNGGFLSNIQKRRHGHRYPLEVQGKNLERFLRNEYSKILSRLSYIKIDAEGYDKDIVYSIMNLLKEYIPVFVSEVYKRLKSRERDFFMKLSKILDLEYINILSHLVIWKKSIKKRI